jgi:hypothetical protein
MNIRMNISDCCSLTLLLFSMRITSIVLLVILLLGLISSSINIIYTPYLIDSPLIPKSMIWNIQRPMIDYAVLEFVFFSASLYFTIKQKYKISIIVACSYILLYYISIYVYSPFI